MRGIDLDGFVASLARKGFERLDARGATARMLRRSGDRHDHVVATLAAHPPWRRWLRRPQMVEDVVVGVLWPIGETAFSRPVPPQPTVPEQVHAATRFTKLIQPPKADPATLAAACDDWCRRLEDPAHALGVGAIADPVRRLEFAALTGNGEVGRRSLDEARSAAEAMPSALQAKTLQRIDVAAARLPTS